MADLRFELILKEKEVILVGTDNVEKKYKLKELTGKQRAEYNSSFGVKMGLDADGKPTMLGDGIIMPSVGDFIALCLYDSNNKLVPIDIINTYPDRVTNALQKEAMELSGMDKKALDAAKNELEESNSSGTE